MMIALLLSSFDLFAQVELADTSKAIVRSITIVRQDVFRPEEDTTSLSRITNKAHLLTKESVIKNFLLFEEGEQVDGNLLAETERKLRRRGFLGGAEIEQKIEGDSIDLVITTWDQWSLIPIFNYESAGGLAYGELGVEEFNLLGYGKNVLIENIYQSDVGNTMLYSYYDPQLLGSRLRASLIHVNGPHDFTFSAAIWNPLFQSDSKWSYGAGAKYDEDVNRMFENGVEVSRHHKTEEKVYGYGMYSFGERYKRWTIELEYNYKNKVYDEIDEKTTIELPENELIHILYAGVGKANHRYVKETRLDKFIRVEDVTLGTYWEAYVGKGRVPFDVGEDRWEMYLEGHYKTNLGEKQYLFLKLNYGTKFERDEILSGRLRYFNKMLPAQTIAMNIETNVGNNLLATRQFILGGASGMRGFDARQFTGTKLFLFNIEDRIFSNLDFHGIMFGGVVFYDMGFAWKEKQAVAIQDLRSSIGAGLRIALTKFPGFTYCSC